MSARRPTAAVTDLVNLMLYVRQDADGAKLYVRYSQREKGAEPAPGDSWEFKQAYPKRVIDAGHAVNLAAWLLRKVPTEVPGSDR